MTWTPATQQAEMWSSETPPKPTMSQLVFSHAFFAGKRVFSLGGNGVWDKEIKQVETWINS